MTAYIAFLLLVFLHFSPITSQTHVLHHSMHDNTTDQLALLSFKSQITHDPSGVLNNWNTTTPLCNWYGITCNVTRQRVTRLILKHLQLEGSLSPHITNLTFLRVLSLRNNSFHGALPADIGGLFRLHILRMEDNQFHGRLPSSLSLCSELRWMIVYNNEFEGNIPGELGGLGKLQILFLDHNHFTGRIPPSLGNLTLLTDLYIGTNYLDGEIPLSLFNISSLGTLSLAFNRLSGKLPSDMFSTLPNLFIFLVHNNSLSGPIPCSIANASNLSELSMSNNNFSGRIPLLSNMRNIRYVRLANNKLGSGGNRDMDFISSLANSNHLELLDVIINKLSGGIPSSVGNLSKNLSKLYLGDNQLEGSLPAEITNLVGLTIFAAEKNMLSGNIPPLLGMMPTLQVLHMDSNRFSGSIPESLGNLSQLYELYLDHNNLTGTIPASLSNAQKLQSIDLSNNMITGKIPREIFTLPNLINFLDLSSNSLSGSIPIQIEKLILIEGISFSNNLITGEIPPSIGACVSLRYLYLNGNFLQGPIPNSLSNLKSIDVIELSSNNLSGKIPSTLQYLKFIKLLNLSMNQLEGEVPKDGVFINSNAISLLRNPELCSELSALALPKCKIHGRHPSGLNMKLMIVVSCVGSGILTCSVIFILWRQNRKKLQTSDEVITFKGQHQLYTYHDLRRATNNFSVDNLIGQGSFGRVYRGILGNERLVAIKVFNMNHDKFLKSFNHECEALRSVRHRNLVRIISACSSSEFKALVLKFMPNGSLEKWLSIPISNFSTVQKLNVAADVAAGIEYLHHDCETPVVHCDLKPSNILLDEDMTAHVADFGLARMLHENPEEGPLSSTLGLKGSVGYIAPEYGMYGEPSCKGDVYSYGILLLEMFTGKKPTDEMFVGDLDLQKWVVMTLADREIDVLDSELVQEDEGVKVVSVLKIGLACASMSPEDRPTMRDVSSMISSAKNEVV